MAMQLANGDKGDVQPTQVQHVAESIFELAVSPGVANKKFTAQQMLLLAEVVGEHGVLEYTQDHQLKLQIPTSNPDAITNQLSEAGFMLAPVGDVLTIKACDFCDGDKKESIPFAEELQKRLGGLTLPKELKLGFNGCGMACYGAVREDIGIVYRSGAFDLFLGEKRLVVLVIQGKLLPKGFSQTKSLASLKESFTTIKRMAIRMSAFLNTLSV